MPRNNYPKRNVEYTMREVYALDLDDTPHFGFYYQDHKTVIQNSHLTQEEFLSVPGLAKTKWTYVRTTNEWIPVFLAVDNRAVIACVDIEAYQDPVCDTDDDQYWVTPKGFPRPQ